MNLNIKSKIKENEKEKNIEFSYKMPSVENSETNLSKLTKRSKNLSKLNFAVQKCNESGSSNKLIQINKNSNLSTNENSKLNVNNLDNEFISQNTIEEKIVKIILIGDKQVGKTTLRNKLIEDFSEIFPTSTLEIKKKLIISNEKITKLEIWDTNFTLISSPIMKSNIFNFSLFKDLSCPSICL